MFWKRFAVVLVLCSVLLFGTGTVFAGGIPPGEPGATLLASGLSGGSGSTVGPDGALYVTEPASGELSRVDPVTGEITLVASGLPPAVVGIGGAMDVAFLDGTAYVLVTLVSLDVGGSDVVGIYRMDGPNSFTPIANIGEWATEHPPDTDFFVPSGLQYALDIYRGAFLVTDGHHNRVLRVTLAGEISEMIAFSNIVPTGLAIRGNKIFMAEAGPTPHLPENGRVVVFGPRIPGAMEIAAGARLLVDVEFGAGHTLYALAQGVWDGVEAGEPALPDTGSLVKVNWDGTFSLVYETLDRPTSLEIIGNTGYVVTLDGEIWKIDGLGGPGKGKLH